MANTAKIKIGTYVYNPTQKIEGTVTEINRTKHEATVRIDSGDEVLFVSSPLAQLLEVKRTERKTFNTASVSTQPEQTLDIKVKYFDKEIDKITKIEKGDWIDLRAAEDVELKKGQFKLIPLGVGMALPEGYEAHLAPRSSTFKKYGIVQTNSVGVVDFMYRGNDDQWLFPAYALKASSIKKNDRICQFRIVEKMPEVTFTEVEHFDEESRGGFGSTGTK